MYAYVDDYAVVVDLDGEKATFDTMIECLWDMMELNITNYDVGALGNDCIGCSMLGIIDNMDVEIRFNDRDVARLNRRGSIRLYPTDVCRDEWCVCNGVILDSEL